MSTIDLLGWIGNIFFVLGAYLLAKKKPMEACLTNIVGNGLYIIVGVVLHTTSLWAISVFLLVLAIYGAYNWKQVQSR